MPTDPDSPESRQIAGVAINEEETIVRRPPLEEHVAIDSTNQDPVPSNDAS